MRERSTVWIWLALLGLLTATTASLTACSGSGDDDTSPTGDDDASTSGDDDATQSGDDDATHSGDDDATQSGDDDASQSGDDDATYLGESSARPPRGDGLVEVERVYVPAGKPPANPSPGEGDTGPAISPDTYDFATYNRYHYKNSTRPVEAILLGMPGFQGGAGDYDYIGRSLVLESEGRIEVWAIDRRSNQMEDHRGTEAAEEVDGADEAISRGMDYYFAGAEVEGEKFTGFLSNPDYPFLSEWGLPLTLQDAYAIAQTIPSEWRQKVLFLAGHSLGGPIVQSFAAWDFDGNPETLEDAGYNQLAGLIMLDGATDPNPDRVTEQATYQDSVAQLRDGSSKRVSSFAGLSADVNVLLELFAVTEVKAPLEPSPLDQVYNYEGVNKTYLTTLFGHGAYTYRATLGLAVDDNFQTAYTFESSVGFLTGGAIDEIRRGGTTYYVPADEQGGTLYGWLDYNEITDQVPDPLTEEVTHIDDLAYACFKGPANFTEWYFPSRLSTDIGTVGDLNVSAAGGDWRWDDYGMAAIHNAQVNIPIMAFFGDQSAPSSQLSVYQASISQTMRSGSTRSGDDFQFHQLDGYEHLDVLLADQDNPGRPNEVLSRLPAWFEKYGLYGTGQGPLPIELVH